MITDGDYIKGHASEFQEVNSCYKGCSKIWATSSAYDALHKRAVYRNTTYKRKGARTGTKKKPINADAAKPVSTTWMQSA